MMVVYHVTSINKFLKILRNGWVIEPPVRAWLDIKEAERFSKQTGRQIILRLKFPGNVKNLKGIKVRQYISTGITYWVNIFKSRKKQ